MTRNLNALRKLVKEQVIEYDYVHYPIALECDINVLVLSKDRSRLNLVCSAEFCNFFFCFCLHLTKLMRA